MIWVLFSTIFLCHSGKVCGNGEEVKFLCEWLHLWHTRGSLTTRHGSADNKLTAQDADYDCCLSECNSDTVDDLKNVLLVTGPVGVCSSFFHPFFFLVTRYWMVNPVHARNVLILSISSIVLIETYST